MKVAYFSNYHESSGYSEAARNYILSLDCVGVQVVPRRISMVGNSYDLPDRIKELEQDDLQGVDVLIQHNLPHEFVYRGGVQNIGMFAYETDSFPNSNWKTHLKMMDKVVVFCHDNASAVRKTCGIEPYVCPHALDIEKTEGGYEKFDLGEFNSSYKFYTIGEWNRRKNIQSTILAYLSEFTIYDDVVLVIKTNDVSSAKAYIKEIKAGTNKYKKLDNSAKIILIDGHLTDDEIYSIHKTCDCYVNTSFGESFCYPAFYAMAFGNQTILPDSGAFRWSFGNIDTTKTNVFGYKGGLPGLYTSDEKWYQIDISQVRDLMRKMSQEKSKNINMMSRIKKIYSFEEVGKTLKDIINAK